MAWQITRGNGNMRRSFYGDTGNFHRPRSTSTKWIGAKLARTLLLVGFCVAGAASANVLAQECEDPCAPEPMPGYSVRNTYRIGNTSGSYCPPYYGANPSDFTWIATAAGQARADWNDSLSGFDAGWEFMYSTGSQSIEIIVTTQGVNPGTIQCDKDTGQLRVHCDMQDLGANDAFNAMDHEFGHMATYGEVSGSGCKNKTAMYYTFWSSTFTGLTDADRCRLREDYGEEEDPGDPLPTFVLRNRSPLSFRTQGKQAKLVPFTVMRYNLPQTLSEAVERAEVIAVVKMLRSRHGVQVVPGHGVESATTHYTAEVLEVLKASDVRQRDRIEILRQGGVITRDGTSTKYYDPSFPDYVLDGEYVVFLEWDEPHGVYVPLGGPELTYGRCQLNRGRGEMRPTFGCEVADSQPAATSLQTAKARDRSRRKLPARNR